jgi:SulP family sulfate permease
MLKNLAIFRPNEINLKNLRGDLAGGVTAAVIALPLALAFGMASGAGPIAGMYGAICVGLMAALFGGTPSQISGPTGPMTIITASVFTQFGDRPALAFTVVMLTGGFQILFGYLKLGRYVNLMPYPVISGFLTGVGCILIIMQLDLLLGFPPQQTITNALTVLPSGLAHANLQALFIGLLAFAIVTLVPRRIHRIVPAPLLALVVCSLLALALSGAPVLGSIPSGLPQWQLPVMDFAVLNEMLIFSVILAALGSIDSLLTSLVADNATRTFHDSDKELVGQGLGNLLAGFAGGIPGAGATIRTLANVQAGGRTPLSAIIHAVVLLAVVLGMSPLVAHIPVAALAGILIKVGVDVIDWRYIKRMHRAPRTDLILMLLVLLLTIFVNVITAVGVGVVLASLVFVKEMAEIQVNSIRTITDPEHESMFDEETAALYRQHREKLMFLHLSGLISFGAANNLVRRFTVVSEYEVLIIDLLDVPHIDGSAALALEQVIDHAIDQKRHVIIVGMTFPVARLLGRLGALNRIRESELIGTRAEAVKAAADFLSRRG